MAETVQIQARARTIPTGWVVGITLALLVIVLWLPFGLNGGIISDAWIYFHQIEQGSIMSQATPTRILWPIFYLVAFQLNPGHFAAFNLFMMLLFFCKGLLVYGLLRRLNVPLALTFAAAVLAIVIPVDSGAFYLGALSIEGVLVCYLLAVYLLVFYWQRRRLSILIGMAVAQFLAAGTYELIYPLMAVAPLVLFRFQRKINWRLVRAAVIWYIVPALCFAWYVYIALDFPRAFQYQTGLVERASLPAILISLLNIYKRHFFDAWVGNLAAVPLTDWALGVVAGIGAFAASCWLRRNEGSAYVPPRLPLILFLSGLTIILLGVALLLPTSLRDQTTRTYYFSSVGAALALAALFWWAARRPVLFAALVGIFVLLGVANLLDQHQGLVDTSTRQEVMLTNLARTLPEVAPGTGIVVVDQSADQGFAQLIGALDVEDMIPLIYHDDTLEGALCLPAEFGTDEQARCRFSDDQLLLPSIRTRVFVRSLNHLILLRYDGQFSVIRDLAPYLGKSAAAYQPDQLYHSDGNLPAPIHDLFGM